MDATVNLKMSVGELDLLRIALRSYHRDQMDIVSTENLPAQQRAEARGKALQAKSLLERLGS